MTKFLLNSFKTFDLMHFAFIFILLQYQENKDKVVHKNVNHKEYNLNHYKTAFPIDLIDSIIIKAAFKKTFDKI